VSLLARLEADLRDLASRTFSDSRVALVDVGRALIAEDSVAGVPDGSRLFAVGLTGDDLESLSAQSEELCGRLESLVRESREQETGSSGGPVTVRLMSDPSLPPATFRVSVDPPDTAAGGSGPIAAGVHSGAGHREAHPADDERLPGTPRLQLAAGGHVEGGTATAEGRVVELELDARRAVVGSAPDANLLLPDDAALPHHLEIVLSEESGMHLARALPGADLLVNGQPQTTALLADGARLEIGSISLVYRRDINPREAAEGLGGREGGEGSGDPVQP
jgi:hypothetical protein